MDFCVLDVEEVNNTKSNRHNDNNLFGINHVFIDFDKFHEYLKSPLYNDPVIKGFVRETDLCLCVPKKMNINIEEEKRR